MPLLHRTVLAIALAVLPLTAQAADDITVTGAYSRVTPAGAPTGIGYMTIRNTGAAADRLIAASSPAVDHVEIHEMAVKDGVMTMRPVPGGLAVPAHGRIDLKPGSYHLMMIAPKAPFTAGETIPVDLTFAHAGQVQVSLAVRPLGGAPVPEGATR